MADASFVKSELDAAPSPAVDDEDLYEDAGDLEFFDTASKDNSYSMVYMAKVPKYIWEAWSGIDDDAEIRIGTIRQWNEQGQDGTQRPRLQMLLTSDRAEHQLVPKEYKLEIGETAVTNTFIFTEEDLPGFKAKTKVRTEAANAGIPASLLRAKQDKVEKPSYEKRGRYQPYYRKAIPKKTKIAARIKYELTCTPVETPESLHLLSLRAQNAMKPKHSLKILGQHATHGIIHHGSTAAMNKFGNFIKTTAPSKPTKTKKIELKTARMPENELLDRIFQCFQDYKYWSMKTLKKHLEQPEAYLRQTLEKVADLHKSGTFANRWSLKPENIRVAAPNLDEIAPDVNDGDGSDEGEDDNDIKMEDVLPS